MQTSATVAFTAAQTIADQSAAAQRLHSVVHDDGNVQSKGHVGELVGCSAIQPDYLLLPVAATTTLGANLGRGPSFTEGSKVSAIERNCVWSRKYENLVNQPFDSSPKELLIGVDFKLRVQHLAKVTESVGSVVTRGFRHSPEIWRICTGTVHQFCSRGADKDPDEWSLSRQFHFAVSASVMEAMIVTSGSVGRQ